MRKIVGAGCVLVAVLGTSPDAAAQAVDVTLFGGLAFPLYDERLTLRVGSPSLPGVDVNVTQSPVLRADGGPVFGAALAFELGIFGIEGRVDATDVGLDFTGARYDLRGTTFPFEGLTASIIAAPGRFDADRITLISLNARLRTPGPVGIIVSGGASYLPDVRVTGSVPLNVDAPGLPLPGIDAALVLRGTPGEKANRFGVNGGAGVRIGGRVGVVAEARGFYFREYELRFATAAGPELLDELLAEARPVQFRPVFVNGQVGFWIRF